MDTLIHADIFFFITTCALVLLTIIAGVALVYVVFIAKNIHYVVKKVKEESDNISGDIAHARQKIRDQGVKLASLMAFLKTIISLRSTKKETPAKKKNAKATEPTDETDISEDLN